MVDSKTNKSYGSISGIPSLGEKIYSEVNDKRRIKIRNWDKMKYFINGIFFLTLSIVLISSPFYFYYPKLPFDLLIISIILLLIIIPLLTYFSFILFLTVFCIGSIEIFEYGLILPVTSINDYYKKNKTFVMFNGIREIFFGTKNGAPGIVFIMIDGKKMQVYKHDIMNIEAIEELLRTRGITILHENEYLSPKIGDSIRTDVVYVPKTRTYHKNKTT